MAVSSLGTMPTTLVRVLDLGTDPSGNRRFVECNFWRCSLGKHMLARTSSARLRPSDRRAMVGRGAELRYRRRLSVHWTSALSTSTPPKAVATEGRDDASGLRDSMEPGRLRSRPWTLGSNLPGGADDPGNDERAFGPLWSSETTRFKLMQKRAGPASAMKNSVQKVSAVRARRNGVRQDLAAALVVDVPQPRSPRLRRCVRSGAPSHKSHPATDRAQVALFHPVVSRKHPDLIRGGCRRTAWPPRAGVDGGHGHRLNQIGRGSGVVARWM